MAPISQREARRPEARRCATCAHLADGGHFCGLSYQKRQHLPNRENLIRGYIGSPDRVFCDLHELKPSEAK